MIESQLHEHHNTGYTPFFEDKCLHNAVGSVLLLFVYH